MIAPVDKYFKVKSEQGSGDRVADKSVLLGYAQDESGMIPFTVPDAPPSDVYWVEPWDHDWLSTYPHKVRMSAIPVDGWLKTRIFNHDLPLTQQRWVRPDIPECWGAEFLAERSEMFKKREGKSAKLMPDPDHWRDPDKLTEEQYEYARLEWHRRIYGIWIMIGGRLTWLSGFHYFYIQHFRIDIGYPGYRDRDRRWFYAWQACYDDPRCSGMVYLKHRRDGATYRCACIGLEIVTRGDMSGKHFGITSKSDDDAMDLFTDKVRYPFDSMVEFFKPMIESGSSTTISELVFNEPKKSSADRFKRKDGLKAWIKTAAKTKNGKARWDGGKIHFGLNDEAGKRPDENIDKLMTLTKTSMEQAGRDGKMMWPTTHEELIGDNAERFQRMWENADISLRSKSSLMVTPNGMFAYFTPAYDGMDADWIGPYGESIVESPTQEQVDFLAEDHLREMKWRFAWDRGWGSYDLWFTKCREESDVIGYLHQFPGTPDDAFRRTNPNTDFNTAMIAAAKQEGTEVQGNGKPLIENLVLRGNLHSIDNDIKKDVYFKEDPNGRFLVNVSLLPVYVGADGIPVPNKGPGWGGDVAMKLRIFANRVKRKPSRRGYNESCGLISPDMDKSRVVIGFDPQKMDEVDSEKGKVRRRSDASAHGFIPYDPTVDGPCDSQTKADNPAFAKDFLSHSFVFEYICKPKDTEQSTMDILRAAIFWSATISYERQVDHFGKSARRLGFITSNSMDKAGDIKRGIHGQYCDGFFIVDPRGIPGWHSDRPLINIYVNFLIDWVEYYCYIRKCPFIKTMDTWVATDPGNMEKYDATVSSGMCGLGAYGMDGFETKQIRNLPQKAKSGDKPKTYADFYARNFR